MPSEKERFELGHVQALLLLTLVNIGLEDWTAAWVLSGQAVRMAVAMGLGTYSGTERSDESRQGRAVFLGCFVIDSLLSFRLGRTTCMDPRDLTTVGHLEEDGLEEWNSWTDVLPPTRGLPSASPPQRGPLLSLSSFNRLVELASVLNKITRNLSGGPSAHVSAQQLLSELKQWDELLPLGCRLLGPESFYPGGQPTLLPHQTYLGLTYAATLLWLNLRIAPTEQGLQHSRRPATERAKKLLLRALPMISQHLENFQMCSFPPIFEVTLRTIAGQAFSLRDTTGVGSFPFTQWMQEFLQRTTELKDTWPVYGSLVSSIEHWQRAGRRSGTQRTPIGSLGLGNASPGGFSGSATMISDMRQMPHQEIQSEIPIHEQASNPLPQSLSSHAISTLMDRNYSATQDPGIGDLDLSMMDGRHQESTDRAPDLLDRLAQSDGPELVSPSAHERPVNSLSSAISPARTDQNMSSGSGLDLSTGAASNLNSPADAANDIDSIFKDLAYLDTTDWAIGREAGLKDFGFMDDTTFQAFCHDPDRLEGSQPLVHPSSIADIWPPPGFFPEAFQDNANETVDR